MCVTEVPLQVLHVHDALLLSLLRTQKTEAIEWLRKPSKEGQCLLLQVFNAGRFVKLPQILPGGRLSTGAHSHKVKQTDLKEYRALNRMPLNSVHHFAAVGARCVPM